MSSRYEWAPGRSGVYIPPGHDVTDGSPAPATDGHSSEHWHVLAFNSGSDGAAITFDSLQELHDWLDGLKANLPKPPPGAGSSVADIDAFLNA